MHLEYCILVSVNTQFSDAKIGEKKETFCGSLFLICRDGRARTGDLFNVTEAL